jgi:hypothetical protein
VGQRVAKPSNKQQGGAQTTMRLEEKCGGVQALGQGEEAFAQVHDRMMDGAHRIKPA